MSNVQMHILQALDESEITVEMAVRLLDKVAKEIPVVKELSPTLPSLSESELFVPGTLPSCLGGEFTQLVM